MIIPRSQSYLDLVVILPYSGISIYSRMNECFPRLPFNLSICPFVSTILPFCLALFVSQRILSAVQCHETGRL